eukprot:GHVU01096243.1.p2 GENE.GHVU01096243.1~~GHVU01096243.1.p2  ORF type:complete len:139 (-),score=6.25 GHVU01096243.1:297-713(-)
MRMAWQTAHSLSTSSFPPSVRRYIRLSGTSFHVSPSSGSDARRTVENEIRYERSWPAAPQEFALYAQRASNEIDNGRRRHTEQAEQGQAYASSLIACTRTPPHSMGPLAPFRASALISSLSYDAHLAMRVGGRGGVCV